MSIFYILYFNTIFQFKFINLYFAIFNFPNSVESFIQA
jgi:hypothetical protein